MTDDNHVVDSDQVATLLRDSRAAHDRARTARSRRQVDEAVTALTLARDLRREADALDPAHTAPAWASERPGHDEMVAFYTAKLGA